MIKTSSVERVVMRGICRLVWVIMEPIQMVRWVRRMFIRSSVGYPQLMILHRYFSPISKWYRCLGMIQSCMRSVRGSMMGGMSRSMMRSNMVGGMSGYWMSNMVGGMGGCWMSNMVRGMMGHVGHWGRRMVRNRGRMVDGVSRNSWYSFGRKFWGQLGMVGYGSSSNWQGLRVVNSWGKGMDRVDTFIHKGFRCRLDNMDWVMDRVQL